MTTTTELCKVNGELIKTDCTGRIRVSPQHREQLLDTFESSGMSGMGFAKYCGVKYSTFASWVQKRKRERNQHPPQHDPAPQNLLSSLAEVKVKLGGKTTAAEICIELPGGASLTLGHLAHLAMLKSSPPPPSGCYEIVRWMFFGNAEAGWVSACIYTLVENCKG